MCPIVVNVIDRCPFLRVVRYWKDSKLLVDVDAINICPLLGGVRYLDVLTLLIDVGYRSLFLHSFHIG